MASNPRGAQGRPTSRLTRAVSSRSHLGSSSRPGTRMQAPIQCPPDDSFISTSTSAAHGTKRKERDGEAEIPSLGDTNINVVVRCRGRNEREVRENSAVVVATEGVKGKAVTLSMGPNAVQNKAYTFDSVFSQAADQSMIFEDVVKPILDEMLAGFNCTIFAYGQTGTGKTYTMSGDMSDTMGLISDAAGIIPRVFTALFAKLESENAEHDVKCSFIELYNEELRDLINPEDTGKLKIFDDASRKGHPTTTMVQGMVERHIHTASDGIKVLQEGSLRRQVAATKCNDLSSRGHTVFTISVLTRKMSEDGGETFLRHGKLNLVDLAGSENIQRSGAENKRATEAGLINKSLLTLGRVINALVDRSQHIPYRESKLTRLLQDSLGGRTKTCIIATISPARSNLEETISTLDYAFRAKNIRNKPQINHLVNRNRLLQDITQEIEKLRSDLIATRQRNGVYLSNEDYEEMTVQSESRRILTEEQAAKIETLEANLRNKVQELYSLTSSFVNLRKEADSTKLQLDTKLNLLEQTELVLDATQKSLHDESLIRKAYQATEEKMAAVGGELITKLQQTVSDVGALHAKSKRKSDLDMLNRKTWGASQCRVSDVTQMVEDRARELCEQQTRHLSDMTGRLQTFVQEELSRLVSSQRQLEEKMQTFLASRNEVLAHTEENRTATSASLDDLDVLRSSLAQEIQCDLHRMTSLGQSIHSDLLTELEGVQKMVVESADCMFENICTMAKTWVDQGSQLNTTFRQMSTEIDEATSNVSNASTKLGNEVSSLLQRERDQMAQERQQLLDQITQLVHSQAAAQESRLNGYSKELGNKFAHAKTEFMHNTATAEDTRKQCLEQLVGFWKTVGNSMEEAQLSTYNTTDKLKEAVRVLCVNGSTRQHDWASLLEGQIKRVDGSLNSLKTHVSQARESQTFFADSHTAILNAMADDVEETYRSLSARMDESKYQVEQFGSHMNDVTDLMQESIEPLAEHIGQPLADLREEIFNTVLQEYEHTGSTPQKVSYQFPTQLPRTEPHERILAAGLAEVKPKQPTPTKSKKKPGVVPTVYSDTADTTVGGPPSRPTSSGLDHGHSSLPNASTLAGRRPTLQSGAGGLGGGAALLREVNPNVNPHVTGNLTFDLCASTMSTSPIKQQPPPEPAPSSTVSVIAPAVAAAAAAPSGGARTSVAPATSVAITAATAGGGAPAALTQTAARRPGHGTAIAAAGPTLTVSHHDDSAAPTAGVILLPAPASTIPQAPVSSTMTVVPPTAPVLAPTPAPALAAPTPNHAITPVDANTTTKTNAAIAKTNVSHLAFPKKSGIKRPHSAITTIDGRENVPLTTGGLTAGESNVTRRRKSPRFK